MANRDSMTKERCIRALLSLCDEHPLEHVAVRDVLERAGIARQTFYNHYRDMNDLILDVFLSYFRRNYQLFFTREGLIEVYRHYIRHKGFYGQLPYLRTQNCFKDGYIRWIKKSYYELTIENMPAGPERERRKATVDAYLYGITALFFEWLKGDMSEVPLPIIDATFGLMPSFVPREPGKDFHIVEAD